MPEPSDVQAVPDVWRDAVLPGSVFASRFMSIINLFRIKMVTLVTFPYMIHLYDIMLQIDSARMSGVNEVRFEKSHPIQFNAIFSC